MARRREAPIYRLARAARHGRMQAAMIETKAEEEFKSAKGFDLSTPAGRQRAETDLMWTDHGFLRRRFHNFHWVSPEMARANQPAPADLARYKAMGIKTILNLRGRSDTGYYWLEREACAALGLALVDAPLGSREAPSVERVLRAKAIFESIEYPALMHCKSGADRAGLMAVLYRHFRQGAPIEEARDQLALTYLHVKHGKTGVLDYVFERYLEETRASGESFLSWVQSPAYDPARLKAEFKPSFWGNVVVDALLRRE